MAEERKKRVISGPGASDFIAAPTGLDTPESGSKGTAYTRDEPLIDADNVEFERSEDADEPDKPPTL